MNKLCSSHRIHLHHRGDRRRSRQGKGKRRGNATLTYVVEISGEKDVLVEARSSRRRLDKRLTGGQIYLPPCVVLYTLRRHARDLHLSRIVLPPRWQRPPHFCPLHPFLLGDEGLCLHRALCFPGTRGVRVAASRPIELFHGFRFPGGAFRGGGPCKGRSASLSRIPQ